MNFWRFDMEIESLNLKRAIALKTIALKTTLNGNLCKILRGKRAND